MRTRLLLPAAACSGAAALLDETLWIRGFSVALGSTVAAAAATMAAFLVGLAAGAWAGGRWSTRATQVPRAYAAAETGTALLAPLLGEFLLRWPTLLPALDPGASTPWKVAHAAAVVVPLVVLPTFLMGTTFPLLVTCLVRAGQSRDAVARLYSANVLGAAVGAASCGFWLLPLAGVRGSYAVAGVLNLTSAALVLLGAAAQPPPERVTARPAQRSRTGLGVAAISGAAVLALEVVWTQLGSFFLGNRTAAASLLLASVLVMLAAGARLAAWLVRRTGTSLLPGLMVAGAVAVILSTQLTYAWVQSQSAGERWLPFPEHLLVLYRALEAILLMGPPFLLLGTLFPVLLAHVADEDHAGEAAGELYLVNTLGTAVGSLVLGYGLLSLAGMGAVVMAVCGLLVVSAWALAPEGDRWVRGSGVAALGLTLALAPGTLVRVPAGETLVHVQEDEHGVLQLSRTKDSLLRVTNNGTELVFLSGHPRTAYVQQMQAHLGMVFQPAARRSLVIGSGYGITAGALARYPGMDRVDAVEIIPAMVALADQFAPDNLEYHRQPNVNVVVDDGRHFLARSSETYDVISVNVSDPHLPGSAAVFHQEFLDSVKAHLAPEGVLVQHSMGAHVNLQLWALRRAFPYVLLFPAYDNGFNAVASLKPLRVDADNLAAQVQAPGVQQALRSIGFLPPLTLVGAVRGQTVEEVAAATDEELSDNWPRLEFAAGDSRSMLFSNE